MDTPIKPNMYYPFQKHAELNVSEEGVVLSFPRINVEKCQHLQVEIDESALDLTCMTCNAKVNPVAWILANHTYMTRSADRLTEQKRKLKEDEAELKRRARTRCTHCGKQTGITLKHHDFKVLRGE